MMMMMMMMMMVTLMAVSRKMRVWEDCAWPLPLADQPRSTLLLHCSGLITLLKHTYITSLTLLASPTLLSITYITNPLALLLIKSAPDPLSQGPLYCRNALHWYELQLLRKERRHCSSGKQVYFPQCTKCICCGSGKLYFPQAAIPCRRTFGHCTGHKIAMIMMTMMKIVMTMIWSPNAAICPY